MIARMISAMSSQSQPSPVRLCSIRICAISPPRGSPPFRPRPEVISLLDHEMEESCRPAGPIETRGWQRTSGEMPC
jgi:hypothetical protein